MGLQHDKWKRKKTVKVVSNFALHCEKNKKRNEKAFLCNTLWAEHSGGTKLKCLLTVCWPALAFEAVNLQE